MSIITVPFSWLLLTLYNFVNNYGLAIILFATVVKLVMLPFQMKSKRSMMRVSRLNPKMKELEKKHEGNKQKYQEEVSKLYKDEKVNPMSGCLWSIIPFPIMIALYSVVRQPLSKMMGLTADEITLVTDTFTNMGLFDASAVSGTYSELSLANLIHENFDHIKGIVSNVLDFDFNFLGINLGATPDWKFFMSTDWGDTSVWLPALGLFMIPVVAAFLSFLSMKVSQTGSTGGAEGNTKGMMLMMPIMSLWFCFLMPAALGVYWIANSLLAIIQDQILNRYYKKKMDAEDAVRAEQDLIKNEEIERKRKETELLREQNATTRNRSTSKKKLQSAEKSREEARQAKERAIEKANRKAELGITDEEPESQVGTRKYARGRSYVSDRYTNPEEAQEATLAASAASDLDEELEAQFAVVPEEGSGETAQLTEGEAIEVDYEELGDEHDDDFDDEYDDDEDGSYDDEEDSQENDD